jgi:glycosyltransferase involved in cell wall biosynthesis
MKAQTQSRGLNVLLVCEYYPPKIGGVEFVFSSLAEGLVKRGNECHVVTCGLPNAPKYEEINGVQIHRVGVPHRTDRYWFTFLAAPKVAKLACKADLIQDHPVQRGFSCMGRFKDTQEEMRHHYP